MSELPRRSPVAPTRDDPPSALRPELERVFRAEYPRVVAIARRVVGSTAAAEDVAQEVFLSFGRASVPVEQAPGWLSVAAAHTALNSLRTDARRTRRETAVGVRAPHAAPDVADEVVAEHGRGRVRAALRTLPRKHALVLLLRHSGMSYSEVAGIVGIPVGSVGTTLRRAEASMREELGDDAAPA